MADASYVIEIASQVSGAGATRSEIDSLSSALATSGVNAAQFDDALATLASQINAAKAASAAANAELAAGKAKYAELEKAAVKAAKGVERMDPASEGYAAAKKAAADAEAAARAYAGELDNLERAAESAAAAQAKLERTSENVARVQKRVNDRLGDAATNFSTFRGALGDIGGPLGEFTERLMYPGQAFVDLNEKFGRGTAIAVVAGFGMARVGAAIVGVLAKMAAGLAVVTAAIVGFAFAASNAARSLALTREAAAIATPALKGIPWSDVANATGVANDRLLAIAKSLADAKVSAADLPAALRAAATEERALGAGGADKFIADMKASKLSVSEFASEVERKYGGVVARQLLGFEAQSARFKRNVGDLFAFDIDPALEGLTVLVALFDKNTSSGRAMRAALSGIMDPIIANAKAAAYAVEAFVLGMLIGATKIYIAVKPAIDAVAKLLGIDTSDWTFADVLDAAAAAGEIAVPVIIVLGTVLGVVAAVILGVIAVVAALSIAFMAIPVAVTAAVWAVGAAVVGLSTYIVNAIGEALSALGDAVGSFASAGADLIAGLVQGILSAGPNVIAAITGIASGAIATAKSILGIASPSTRMRDEVGANLGEGVVVGVESKTDAVHAAIAELTDPSAASDAAATSPSSSVMNSSTNATSSSATTIYIDRVELPNVTDRAAFLSWLEGIALQGATA